jgi:hypothetical protein
MEAVLLKERDRAFTHPIGQKSDSKEIFLPRVVDSVVQQLAAHPLPAKATVDDEIFQKNDKTTFGGADSKEQINHSDYLIRTSQHKNPATAGLLQDQTQSPHLVCVVRPKIRFLRKQIHQQLRKQGQILNGSGFDASQFVHANKKYYKTIINSEANLLRKTPIIDEVYSILSEKAPASEAIEPLLKRELRPEEDAPALSDWLQEFLHRLEGGS